MRIEIFKCGDCGKEERVETEDGRGYGPRIRGPHGERPMGWLDLGCSITTPVVLPPPQAPMAGFLDDVADIAPAWDQGSARELAKRARVRAMEEAAAYGYGEGPVPCEGRAGILICDDCVEKRTADPLVASLIERARSCALEDMRCGVAMIPGPMGGRLPVA